MRPSATTDRRTTLRRAVVVADATVAAIVVWIIARVADVDFEVETWTGDTMDVGLGIVAAAALGASLAGWGLVALLQRRTSRALDVWTAVAIAALLVSLPGPVFADASAGARLSLTLMHLAAAAVLIPGMRSAAPARHRWEHSLDGGPEKEGSHDGSGRHQRIRPHRAQLSACGSAQRR